MRGALKIQTETTAHQKKEGRISYCTLPHLQRGTKRSEKREKLILYANNGIPCGNRFQKLGVSEGFEPSISILVHQIEIEFLDQGNLEGEHGAELRDPGQMFILFLSAEVFDVGANLILRIGFGLADYYSCADYNIVGGMKNKGSTGGI